MDEDIDDWWYDHGIKEELQPRRECLYLAVEIDLKILGGFAHHLRQVPGNFTGLDQMHRLFGKDACGIEDIRESGALTEPLNFFTHAKEREEIATGPRGVQQGIRGINPGIPEDAQDAQEADAYQIFHQWADDGQAHDRVADDHGPSARARKRAPEAADEEGTGEYQAENQAGDAQVIEQHGHLAIDPLGRPENEQHRDEDDQSDPQMPGTRADTLA